MILEHVLGYFLSVDKCPIKRTQVFKDVLTIDPIDVAVFLRDDTVEHLHGIVRMPSQTVVAAQRISSGFLRAEDAYSRHRLAMVCDGAPQRKAESA